MGYRPAAGQVAASPPKKSWDGRSTAGVGRRRRRVVADDADAVIVGRVALLDHGPHVPPVRDQRGGDAERARGARKDLQGRAHRSRAEVDAGEGGAVLHERPQRTAGDDRPLHGAWLRCADGDGAPRGQTGCVERVDGPGGDDPDVAPVGGETVERGRRREIDVCARSDPAGRGVDPCDADAGPVLGRGVHHPGTRDDTSGDGGLTAALDEGDRRVGVLRVEPEACEQARRRREPQRAAVDRDGGREEVVLCGAVRRGAERRQAVGRAAEDADPAAGGVVHEGPAVHTEDGSESLDPDQLLGAPQPFVEAEGLESEGPDRVDAAWGAGPGAGGPARVRSRLRRRPAPAEHEGDEDADHDRGAEHDQGLAAGQSPPSARHGSRSCPSRRPGVRTSAPVRMRTDSLRMKRLVRRVGLEPTTYRLRVCCSNQLS